MKTLRQYGQNNGDKIKKGINSFSDHCCGTDSFFPTKHFSLESLNLYFSNTVTAIYLLPINRKHAYKI